MTQFQLGGEKRTMAAIDQVYGPTRPELAQQIIGRYANWQGYWIHYLRFGA